MPSTSGGAANSSYALLFLLPHLPSSPTFFSSSLTSTFAVHLVTLFSHLDYYHISPIVFPLPFLLHLLHPSILHVIAGGTFKYANPIINSPDGNLPKTFFLCLFKSCPSRPCPRELAWPPPAHRCCSPLSLCSNCTGSPVPHPHQPLPARKLLGLPSFPSEMLRPTSCPAHSLANSVSFPKENLASQTGLCPPPRNNTPSKKPISLHSTYHSYGVTHSISVFPPWTANTTKSGAMPTLLTALPQCPTQHLGWNRGVIIAEYMNLNSQGLITLVITKFS